MESSSSIGRVCASSGETAIIWQKQVQKRSALENEDALTGRYNAVEEAPTPSASADNDDIVMFGHTAMSLLEISSAKSTGLGQQGKCGEGGDDI
jgi:hypothetical protein